MTGVESRAVTRAAPLALVLIAALGLLAFEEGLHSVHHLPDHAGASTCSVAAVSDHAPVASAGKTLVERPARLVYERPRKMGPPRVEPEPIRPRPGRAPPIVASPVALPAERA
jgi:hypothetical protein